jgi:transposase-like protein
MAYRKQEMSSLVEAKPREAADEIVALYEKCQANQQKVAEKIGCHETTLIRWVKRLEARGTHIAARMEKVRRRAQKAGVTSTRPPQGWRRRLLETRVA